MFTRYIWITGTEILDMALGSAWEGKLSCPSKMHLSRANKITDKIMSLSLLIGLIGYLAFTHLHRGPVRNVNKAH